LKNICYRSRTPFFLTFWLSVLALALAVNWLLPICTNKTWHRLAGTSGLTVPQLLAVFAGILAISEVLKLVTQAVLARRNKPLAEGMMIGRLYQLVAMLAILLSFAAGLGALSAFGAFFAMFGGMLLGWSLQAPVSGFAAYLLVSLKRPFRPGDRVQFPNLGLTGDVKDVGVMYTTLDQVGGSIGSEEAVGRDILVPNAMLFSQVVINYTVTQGAAYMLDEVVVRITYDSNWEVAEKVLLGAAQEVTKPFIEATGTSPYIRSDLYDYGVYLRLRYQTAVQDRVETAYRIQKRIFEEIQKTPEVDLAIPFVYSYRSGMDKRDETQRDKEERNVREIEVVRVNGGVPAVDQRDIEQLARSIATQGLLQPIIVAKAPKGNGYDIMAGHLRFEACKRLGWKTIPAVIVAPQQES